MNLNATFVHNYPLLHTYFIAIFLLFLISPFLKADWGHPGITRASGGGAEDFLPPERRPFAHTFSKVGFGRDQNSFLRLSEL